MQVRISIIDSYSQDNIHSQVLKSLIKIYGWVLLWVEMAMRWHGQSRSTQGIVGCHVKQYMRLLRNVLLITINNYVIVHSWLLKILVS